MNRLASLLIATIFSLSSRAQSLLNSPAPPLNIQSVIQGGNIATLESAQGKFIFLEFWATWCTPCVRNIPHLNELQEKFKDRNIIFISISDEPQATVASFLNKRKINGLVALDSTGLSFKSYHVSARPTTIIIDNKRNIVFVGEPTMVNEQLINELLEGKKQTPHNQPEAATNKLGGFGGGEDPAITANFNMKKMGYLYQEVIRSTVKANFGYGTKSQNGSVGISIIGYNLPHAIAILTHLPTHLRIINNSVVSDTSNWDFIFSRSNGYTLEHGEKVLLNDILTTFSIALKDTVVAQNVFIPTITSNKKLVVKTNTDEEQQLDKTYLPLSNIFNQIENKANKIVLYDSTAYNTFIDTYELGNKYYSMTAKELINWMEAQGITLTSKTQKVQLKAMVDNREPRN